MVGRRGEGHEGSTGGSPAVGGGEVEIDGRTSPGLGPTSSAYMEGPSFVDAPSSS